MKKDEILLCNSLSISFLSGKNKNTVVKDVSFSLLKNEILGIVGESGSGKSVSSMAILGLLPKKNTEITGEIFYNNTSLLQQSSKSWQHIRGNEISMIFQEPMTALNPSMRCGKQVDEILKIHKKDKIRSAKAETISLFEKVKIANPEALYNKYPHQISGGQMQRVMIAMAIACKPKILIADEPTTALDVTVQKEIILLLKELQQENEMSIMFISHDLALVSEIADRVLVMYKGEIVEQGTVREIFENPAHKYTQALLLARPKLSERLEELPTIQDVMAEKPLSKTISLQERALKHKILYEKFPLLEVVNLEKEYFSHMGIFKKNQVTKAVNGVSFRLYEGETLGLVGESGCGKSTLGKTILHLENATAGTIKYRGKDITHLNAGALRELRKEIQIIFQDPYSSLNPRLLVGEAILEVMQVHHILSSQTARKEKAFELLELAGLPKDFYYRYPHELSGGQRQRIGIARTIALQPKLIICDESVSALDISVQAQVLNLLNRLKEQFQFTYIFISHDLSVVKYMSDQLLVMKNGKIEEIGEADETYENPRSLYTKQLIDSIPKGL